MYVCQTKNLVEGNAYPMANYIYNPAYPTIGPPTYPPVCSLLLAPVYMLYGMNFEVMKLVMLVSLAFYLLFVFLCFRKELPLGYTAAIVTLVGLSPGLLGGANSIGSDLPFMALLYLTILVIFKAYDTADDRPPRYGYLLLAAVLICVLYGTRTLGILALPSLLLYDVLRYRRITPSAILAGSLVAAGIAAQSFFLHSDVSYFDQYHVSPLVFLKNGVRYGIAFAGFWDNEYSKPLGAILFLTLTAFGAVGYVSSVRQKITFLEIFPVVYLAAVLLFPGYAGTRYLGPIFPLYLLFVARGLQSAWFVERQRLHQAVLAVLLVGVTATYGAAFTQVKLDVTEGISKPDSRAMFDYIARHTKKDDVIVFIKPRVMALLTARKSSAYHMPAEDAELWDYLGRIGATYLVVVENDDAFADAEDPVRLEYLRDFVARNAGKLTPVFGNPDLRVYRIIDDRAGQRTLLSGT
jgi:hypothetical protein